ncbi:MAG: Qat anti-phage system TatD family nuclease QatD [Desulfitobacteriia bacterium]|jgi:TatD DNase family protein
MNSLNTGRLVDCHFHLDLFENPVRIATEIEASGVEVIAVTNTPSVFKATQNLVSCYKYIHASLGLHPQLVGTRSQELVLMENLMKETRFIGEVGLDYTTGNEQEIKLQRKVFEEILKQCAAEGNKILNVHSRRAASDVIAMIGPNYPGRVILHWFSGTIKDLKKAMEYGMYISVNISMVRSAKGQSLIKHLDPNLVLTETDGPFVRVGKVPAVPAEVINVIYFLANAWKCDLEEAKARVYANYFRAVNF